MSETIIISHSSAETQQLGENFGRQIVKLAGQKPIIFALQGELGAGKTQFVKGIAKGLNISQLITSPSYTLVNEYSFEHQQQVRSFVHIDAWRLPNLADLESIGWSRFLSEKAVIALEWADLPNLDDPIQITYVFPIKFSYESATNDRQITFPKSLENLESKL